MSAVLIAFGVVFIAEMGDKSQILAMTFATRYRPWAVFGGIVVAVALLMALSVGIGAALGSVLPERLLSGIAAAVFIGFAVWTLVGDDEGDDADATRTRGGRSAFVAVALTFFVSEVGDKTMLATIALAAEQGALATWLGATLGMVAADGLAIVVGHQLGERLPRRWVRRGVAALFAVFGILLAAEAIRA